MLRTVFVVLVVATIGQSARADVLHNESRDTSRLSMTAGYGMFASFPGSYEDPGPMAVVSRPLWLGTRYSFFQWQLTAMAIAGLGTESLSAHLAGGPQFGFNLFLGSVFGFEFRMGLAGIVQVGSDSALGLGLSGGGGYVFRFWDDDRKRLKLDMNMFSGAYFAEDPGNDMALNANALSIGLAYESPF